jgi:hypothetical protein
MFVKWTSSATGTFVTVPTEADIDRWVLFKDCDFMTFPGGGGTQLTNAMYTVTGLGSGALIVSGGSFVGCTNVATSPNNLVQIVAVVPTSTTSGLAVNAAAA